MADLPSIARRLQIEETRFKSAVSESLAQKLGGTMNFLLDNYAIPPGAIFDYGGDEGTVPLGWIICDGRAVSRTTYANLYTAIGTRWGIGDGASTFNVPDLRGSFTRMVDLTTEGQKGADPDHATRTRPGTGTGTAEQVGSYQGDAVGPHNHRLYTNPGSGSGYYPRSSSGDVDPQLGPVVANSGTETRPKNWYVMKIIKT